jgi:hypothetical protein
MSDTVQLLKFVISIDDFNIGIELTCVWLVEVTTTGALCLNITELCNNTGASHLVGILIKNAVPLHVTEALGVGEV